VGDTLLILAGSLMVTLLATLHPASSAARLYPIEAIRSE
jgi:ABC-type lipoprotein release transport system permease subunit